METLNIDIKRFTCYQFLFWILDTKWIRQMLRKLDGYIYFYCWSNCIKKPILYNLLIILTVICILRFTNCSLRGNNSIKTQCKATVSLWHLNCLEKYGPTSGGDTNRTMTKRAGSTLSRNIEAPKSKYFYVPSNISYQTGK